MPRARRVVWAPQATRDLRSVWRYYARVASPDIADNLLREIAQAAERLKRESLRGRSRDELSPGLCSVLAHPYTIFYRVRNGTVEIVRVLHERRNFPALFAKGE